MILQHNKNYVKDRPNVQGGCYSSMVGAKVCQARLLGILGFKETTCFVSVHAEHIPQTGRVRIMRREGSVVCFSSQYPLELTNSASMYTKVTKSPIHSFF